MMRLAPALPLQIWRPTRAAPLATVAESGAPNGATDAALGDWHDLFCAVTERLRSTQNPAEVLECVEAMDQLGATLKHEIGRCQHERDQAQAALAQALDGCAGTRGESLYARYLARHDSLTSLPDRELFLERLEHALRDAAAQRRAVAVLYLGLEGCRVAADPQGPGDSEALFWAVGARLTRAVRADDLVSHFGQDEFACLLPDVPGPEPVGEVARKLLATLSAPLRISARTYRVRPSIGIAMGAAADPASAMTLLGHADAAMVRARRHGLGHAFHA
jgi:diguanylate cyclase